MEKKVLKLAMITPKLKVADVSSNVDEILKLCHDSAKNGANVAVLPELAVTGATCGDLFLHKQLYQSAIDGIKRIISFSESIESTIIFGSYLEIENKYYDCIFIVESGILMGIVPKKRSLTYGGLDFGRWFANGADLEDIHVVETELSQMPVAFGDILFEDAGFGLDIMIKNGSDIYFYNDPEELPNEQDDEKENPLLILNPSAESTQIELNSRRLQYFKEMSGYNGCAYAFVSPGVYESTTDPVFSGQTFAVSKNNILAWGKNYSRRSEITYAHLDTSSMKPVSTGDIVGFSYDKLRSPLIEDVSNPLPFVPQDKDRLDLICEDAFTIQANALATRLEHIGSKKALIGISGGLDSTLALLVIVEAFKAIGKDIKDIITITMPGFGTSDITFENALSLMKLLGTDLREISIVESVKQHFKDIGHDIEDKNKAYENAQARERTQILMDLANDVNGVVIGTGDLSEEALGWSTYGGDHLSMYGVNATIPKTFIPYILNWVADNKKGYTDDNEQLKETLKSVIQTPISPELLPADEKGQIAQKTEESVGPYELHDYFIYHTMLNGMSPIQILDNAEKAFAKAYDRDTIKKWLKVFYQRFFSQQFKRNCSVEGPMVTHISMSPRGSLTMPSDAVVNEWIKALR